MLAASSWATHNKAGEITYKRLSGLTYQITITTYTDPSWHSRPEPPAREVSR